MLSVLDFKGLGILGANFLNYSRFWYNEMIVRNRYPINSNN